jgi:hypothetical protein
MKQTNPSKSAIKQQGKSTPSLYVSPANHKVSGVRSSNQSKTGPSVSVIMALSAQPRRSQCANTTQTMTTSTLSSFRTMPLTNGAPSSCSHASRLPLIRYNRYYLPKQKKDEVIFVKTYDSEAGVATCKSKHVVGRLAAYSHTI